MDAVGGASNWRLPERLDVLYDSERTRVTRLWMPDGPVIRKEPLRQDRDKRVRNEVAVLERLAGVEGVAQLADVPAYPGSIMLADVDGGGLDHRTMPIDIDELLDLGLALARGSRPCIAGELCTETSIPAMCCSIHREEPHF